MDCKARPVVMLVVLMMCSNIFMACVSVHTFAGICDINVIFCANIDELFRHSTCKSIIL